MNKFDKCLQDIEWQENRGRTVVSNWISVEERLPVGVSNNYLAFRPKAPGSKVCSLWYDTQNNGWSGVFTVSHWSVLPEGPLGNRENPTN